MSPANTTAAKSREQLVTEIDDDPRACYTVLSADGADLSVSFNRVEYSVERMARAIEDSGIPTAFVDMLRTGTS